VSVRSERPWEVRDAGSRRDPSIGLRAEQALLREQALSPLGYELIMEPRYGAAGLGRSGKPDFWVFQGESGHAVHVAFVSDDRATVEAFHEAAIAAGGRDNGRPGLRPEYHASYCGAFALDPDDNNIEAVCHGPGKEA
jgi:catechol 2,3-dioxygenase-like lactoylglutathione lyase family enzyme